MTSELVVDYDPTVWLLLDPGEEDPEDWAVAEAEQCLQEAGLDLDAEDVTTLSTRLLTAYDAAAGLAGFRLLHLPAPLATPGPLTQVTAYGAGDGSEESLRAVVGADAPDLVEPADTGWVETPLGVALRCRRYVREEASGPRFLRRQGAVLLSLSYVWHLPGEDTDVKLEAASYDVGGLTAVLDDVDALARAVRLEAVTD